MGSHAVRVTADRDDAEWLQLWLEGQIEELHGPERWVVVRWLTTLQRTLKDVDAGS